MKISSETETRIERDYIDLALIHITDDIVDRMSYFHNVI